MKQILDLLNQLDTKSDELYSIQLFGDFSGQIIYQDEGIRDFNDKKDCIKILKRLLNER